MTSKETIRLYSTKKYPGFLWVFICLLIFSLTACSDDDPISVDPNGGEEIEISASFTISNDEPAAGEEVTLDASESTISETGSSLQYSWTLTTPEDSEAELENTDSVETKFIADIGGEYSVTLEVTFDDLTESEEKLITALAYEELNSNITENRTLFSDVLYRVTSSFVVSAELTIEPGTLIEFEENTGIQFNENSVIIADGTEQDSIRFTGTEEVRGHWNGLHFHGTQSTSNLLNYVIVEYGGNDQGVQNASLSVADDARIQVTNSTFRQSEGVGLYLAGNSSRYPDAAGNTYTENGQGAVATQASLLHYLDDESDYSGNDTDRVFVSSETVSNGDQVWQGINAWYEMDGRTRVEDVDLTIEAGGEFRFTAGSDLIFRGDGTFLVDGNRDAEVLFTGTEQDPGWWNGIQVAGAPNPNNLMRHAVIEYGGGGNMYDFSTQDVFANLLIGGRTSNATARLSVQNSTFRHSADYGLKISGRGGGSHMPDASSNIYTDNAEGAAFTQTNSMHYFASSSDFTGNDSDYVVITTRLSDSSVSGVDQTWNRLNVPYRMIAIEDRAKEINVSDVDVTIEPGAEFHFASDMGLSFGENSSIHAVATEDDPIIFTGTEELAGWWSGIQISSLSPDNRIEHAHFSFGGSDNGFSNWSTQSDFANLLVGGRTSSHAGRLHAENNLFANSEGYGIKATADSDINEDVCDDNDFDENSEGECLIK